METNIGNPKNEATLYNHMKKVRPYLDEVMSAIERTELECPARTDRSVHRFR